MCSVQWNHIPWSWSLEVWYTALVLVNHKSSEILFLQNQPLCTWKWTHLLKVVDVDSWACSGISHLLIRTQNEASRPGVEFVVKQKEWSCYFSKLDAQSNFHLKIQKGVQHIMAGADVPSGILLPLLMTYSRVLWGISPEHGTICESGLKLSVGVSVFLFLSRAVDALTTEMENYKWTF